MAAPNDVSSHFAGRDPSVLATYEAILGHARSLGPVKVESKKTSIHLVRTTAFAGVATRKSWLILTFEVGCGSEESCESRSTSRRRRTAGILKSSSRARLGRRELKHWLAAAYKLAGT
jgi:hypothetical protein